MVPLIKDYRTSNKEREHYYWYVFFITHGKKSKDDEQQSKKQERRLLRERTVLLASCLLMSIPWIDLRFRSKQVSRPTTTLTPNRNNHKARRSKNRKRLRIHKPFKDEDILNISALSTSSMVPYHTIVCCSRRSFSRLSWSIVDFEFSPSYLKSVIPTHTIPPSSDGGARGVVGWGRGNYDYGQLPRSITTIIFRCRRPSEQHLLKIPFIYLHQYNNNNNNEKTQPQSPRR